MRRERAKQQADVSTRNGMCRCRRVSMCPSWTDIIESILEFYEFECNSIDKICNKQVEINKAFS